MAGPVTPPAPLPSPLAATHPAQLGRASVVGEEEAARYSGARGALSLDIARALTHIHLRREDTARRARQTAVRSYRAVGAGAVSPALRQGLLLTASGCSGTTADRYASEKGHAEAHCFTRRRGL